MALSDAAVREQAPSQLEPAFRSSTRFDCLLPRAVAWDEAGQRTLVACLGIDALVGYDTPKASGSGHAFGSERFRVPLGAGPTGIALDPTAGRAFVWSAFDRSLAIITLAAAARFFPPFGTFDEFTPRTPGARAARRQVILPTAHSLDPAVDRGRRLFHATGDARISRDGRACATCHPGGREDGLVWHSSSGPRQTPMLVGRLDGTAPYGWLGANLRVEDHLRGTIADLGGSGLGDDAREALAAYLASLDVPSAWTAPATPTTGRGAELFTAHCASCHVPESAWTDRTRHDIGTRAPRDFVNHGERGVELISSFDTPSLRFVGHTAPYFHDGRYPTLRALLEDPKSAMVTSAALAAADIEALLSYLETL